MQYHFYHLNTISSGYEMSFFSQLTFFSFLFPYLRQNRRTNTQQKQTIKDHIPRLSCDQKEVKIWIKYTKLAEKASF